MKMGKNRWFFFLIGVFVVTGLSAQRVERDSLWIQQTLSNGGEIMLNDATIEAIRRGTLLNAGLPELKLQLEGRELPVSKEFDYPGMLDNPFYDLNIWHLSPSEGLLYQLHSDSIFIIKRAFLFDNDSLLVKEYYPIPFHIPHTPLEIRGQENDPADPPLQAIEGEWRTNLNYRTVIPFSAEEGLEDLFDPSERAKRHNRKNANAWKTYNMEE